MSDTCAKCASNKIIRNVPLKDHYGDTAAWSQPAALEVSGKPKAWIFTDKASGDLRASICGDCGHVELHVTNYRQLYEKYQNAAGGKSSA